MIKRAVRAIWVLGMAWGIASCQTSLPLVLSPSDLEQVTDVMVKGFGVDANSSKGRILKQVGKRTFSDPVQYQLFAGFMRDTKDAAQAVPMLLKEGLPNLTDQQLKKRVRIMLMMLERASPSDCAKFSGFPRYTDRDHIDGLKAGLLLLSDEDFRDYIEMNFEASMAGLRMPKPKQVQMSSQEWTDVMIIIGKQIPRSEQEGWITALKQPMEVSDAGYCDANKSMYRSMLSLDGVDAKRALRLEFAKIGD